MKLLSVSVYLSTLVIISYICMLYIILTTLYSYLFVHVVNISSSSSSSFYSHTGNTGKKKNVKTSHSCTQCELDYYMAVVMWYFSSTWRREVEDEEAEWSVDCWKKTLGTESCTVSWKFICKWPLLSQCLWSQSFSIVVTLHASCGAVYCNRSCLWVCVCVCLFVGLLPR